MRPNPVDKAKFVQSSEGTKLAARKNISSAAPDDILIVYVAKYITRKNHAFLLHVLAKLPDHFKLVLAGPPLAERDLVPGLTADQITTLDQRAIDLGIDKRVNISHGFVDMKAYLSAADIFCFPAEKEAMGTPVLESISTGVPVVANADKPSFQEWVVNGENGYLCALEPSEWAAAIVKAAAFDSAKKTKKSDDIKAAISTDLIDEQYRKLLDAVAATNHNQQVDVHKIIGD
jgi:glycosyltransferase involved in cell wall biosynthesis